jgi:glycosyltransferase involved in cell wall biosynthesis
MSRATDATIVVTDYLRSLYPPELQPKILVVHDGIEQPDVCKTSWRADRGSRRNLLRAVLVSSDPLHELPLIVDPPEWLEVEIVGSYSPIQKRLQRVREARWKLSSRKGFHESIAYLRFLTNRRIRRVAWDPVGVYESLKRADIGIIPINTSPGPELGESSPRWKVKSENRLTLKMAAGLPVIATPIPAYEPVMEHGRSGFFARSRGDWIECLDALRDPMRRRTVGERARESVLTKYSKEEQARLLIEVLRKVSQSCASSPGPKKAQQRRS